MRYPIGMDLYQNRPVRKIEHEKGEGKSLLSPITTLSQMYKNKAQALLAVHYSGQTISIMFISSVSPLLFLQPFKTKI